MKRIAMLLLGATTTSCNLVTGELPCEQDANCPAGQLCYATVDHELHETLAGGNLIYRDGLPATVCRAENESRAAPVSLFALGCFDDTNGPCARASLSSQLVGTCAVTLGGADPVIAKRNTTKLYAIDLGNAGAQTIPCTGSNDPSSRLVGKLLLVQAEDDGTLMLETSRSASVLPVRIAIPEDHCDNVDSADCHIDDGANVADRNGARVDLAVSKDQIVYVFLVTPDAEGFGKSADLAIRLE